MLLSEQYPNLLQHLQNSNIKSPKDLVQHLTPSIRNKLALSVPKGKLRYHILTSIANLCLEEIEQQTDGLETAILTANIHSSSARQLSGRSSTTHSNESSGISHGSYTGEGSSVSAMHYSVSGLKSYFNSLRQSQLCSGYDSFNTHPDRSCSYLEDDLHYNDEAKEDSDFEDENLDGSFVLSVEETEYSRIINFTSSETSESLFGMTEVHHILIFFRSNGCIVK